MKKSAKMLIVLLVMIIIAEAVIMVRYISTSKQQVVTEMEEEVPEVCEICGKDVEEVPFKISIHYGMNMDSSLFDVYVCEDHAYTAYDVIVSSFSQELSQ